MNSWPGDLQAAHRSYATALDADPLNLDALLGMATIEARTNNRMLAQNHYRKALEIDPRNPTALAGLAAISQFTGPEGTESQLRANLAVSPGSAALHFTLGNLYATQSRWGDAQVEYFEAYRIDPANADTAYNLAVSLDHMRQPKLAAEYYTRAIEAARFRPRSSTRRPRCDAWPRSRADDGNRPGRASRAGTAWPDAAGQRHHQP